MSYELDEDAIQQFRKGTAATIVFDSFSGGMAAYDLSLIGFSQAYKTLADSHG